MKIGILTLPIAENYGGILQAVALSQYLTQEGHDVTLIYKETQPTLWKEIVKKTLLMIPCHNFLNVKSNAKIKKEAAARTLLHQDFINKEIPNISPSLSSSEELTAYANQQNFDAVIVGSDQVWRKAYINDSHYLSYFLDFIRSTKTKKIAYAASFGKDQWEGKGDESKISDLLHKFSAISVREASGVDICNKTFNIKNVEHVLDPTLLMDKQFYLDLIKKYDLSKIESKKIVTYVLDEASNKKNIIHNHKDRLGLSSDDILHLKGFSHTARTYTIPEWLFAIANANFVITDSFHGMVFAIIFEKDFVVIGNKDRGLERFTSLLSILKLNEYLISDPHKHVEKNINYETVDLKLQEIKAKALLFLQKALSGKL